MYFSPYVINKKNVLLSLCLKIALLGQQLIAKNAIITKGGWIFLLQDIEKIGFIHHGLCNIMIRQK